MSYSPCLTGPSFPGFFDELSISIQPFSGGCFRACSVLPLCSTYSILQKTSSNHMALNTYTLGRYPNTNMTFPLRNLTGISHPKLNSWSSSPKHASPTVFAILVNGTTIQSTVRAKDSEVIFSFSHSLTVHINPSANPIGNTLKNTPTISPLAPCPPSH